ncbi:MAG: hypothetical protein ACI9YE_003199 [Psychroserpens sp.]|jgi:hypothetical protein
MTEGFLKCIWITITIFLVSSCIEDKPTEPIVQALQAPEISENSEFIVEVISQIPSENIDDILDHGIIWSTSELLQAGQYSIMSFGQPDDSFLRTEISHDLIKDKEYFVRVFVDTHSDRVAGPSIKITAQKNSFLPEIHSVYPEQYLEWGDTINIRGRYFTNLERNIEVTLGELKINIIHVNDTSILARVIPSSEIYVDSAYLGVKILPHEVVRSQGKVSFVTSKELLIESLSFDPGDTISIYGSNFDMLSDYIVITLNDEVIPYLKTSDEKIDILINPNLKQNNPSLKVIIQNKVTFFNLVLNQPRVFNIVPSTLYLNTSDTILIKGAKLGSRLGLNDFISVYVNDFRCKVLNDYFDSLEVKVMWNKDFSFSGSGNLRVEKLDQHVTVQNALQLEYEGPWTEISSFPSVFRDNALITRTNNGFYIGYGNNNNIYLNDLWYYNYDSDKWVKHVLESSTRIISAMATSESQLFTFGCDQNTCEITVYDLNTHEYQSKVSFPGHYVSRPFMYYRDEALYIGGGTSNNNGDTFEFRSFNLNDSTWRLLQDVPDANMAFLRATDTESDFMANNSDLSFWRFQADRWTLIHTIGFLGPLYYFNTYDNFLSYTKNGFFNQINLDSYERNLISFRPDGVPTYVIADKQIRYFPIFEKSQAWKLKLVE